ncbi:hypothetical protein HYH03_004669 [Edaphochlamys debaryana]|uniref:Transmembrane protein n=1 Tax=Edaphochlamys debaryana TaxID=47281 RepID=A0A835Y771_9CHLO|nr:hypothetical protein HYH03_004669 [Edaphochlamys debaryana]|eukprot:KAG2497520.1 hypothetical protein HYH03_004669 [Edaphochlamys debaryana]
MAPEPRVDTREERRQKRKAAAAWTRRKATLESLFWAALAIVVVVYGNGTRDLLSLMILDDRVNKLFTFFGLINMLFNGLLFLYVYGWLGYVCKVADPARSETLAVPVAAVTMLCSIVSFMIALWPVFSVLAVVQVMVVTYGAVSALAWVPGVGPLAPSRPKRAPRPSHRDYEDEAEAEAEGEGEGGSEGRDATKES